MEVIRSDARHFLSRTAQYFDRILLDAPCTSEGRIQAARPKSWNFWKPEHILRNAALQRDLIAAAYSRLKVGGTLVYSTCTLAPEENEMIIAEFLASHSDMSIEPIELSLNTEEWWTENIDGYNGHDFSMLKRCGVRILPSQYTEGFFLVKMRKR